MLACPADFTKWRACTWRGVWNFGVACSGCLHFPVAPDLLAARPHSEKCEAETTTTTERHDGRGLPDSSSPAARQRDLQHRALSCDGKSSAPRKLPTEGASVGFPARDWLARPSRATRDATLARAGCSGKGHANGWQPSACGEPKPGKGNTKGPGPARPTSDLDLLPPSAALLCTGKQASPGGNAANGEFRTIEQPGCRSSCKQAGSCVELAESALVRVRHGAKRPESCPFFSVLEP